jgi:hypothetical protein
VDAIGVETPPTFVIWWMAMAATIQPPCLLYIPLDVRWLYRVDVQILLAEIAQEMAGHGETLTRGSGSVAVLNQMLS